MGTLYRLPSLLILTIILIQLRKLFAQVFQFGKVIEADIGIVGMMRGVVLMIVLGGIEAFQGNYLSHNGCGERFDLIDLADVGLGDALLVFVGVEDDGAIFQTGIWALAV